MRVTVIAALLIALGFWLILALVRAQTDKEPPPPSPLDSPKN